MEVKLMNATGAGITVNVELSDTPRQIITKAIEQCGEKTAILMRTPNQFQDLVSGGLETIQETESLFAVDGKAGNRALEFNLPIQEQVKQELGEANAAGRTLGFIVALALIVGRW